MSEEKSRRCQPGELDLHKDFPVLLFLWEWKVASTAAIAVRFFHEWTRMGHTAYKRLQRLHRLGYVKTKFDEHAGGCVWTLARRGFDAVVDSLPPLVEAGAGSEAPRHDRFSMAVHLGPGLVAEFGNVFLYTEQQLRRIDPRMHPEWVPKMDGHRPDGYWNVPSSRGRKIVCLEIEFSRKLDRHYREIGQFYASCPTIGNVIWAVPTVRQAERIRSFVSQGRRGSGDVHKFFLLREIKSRGWESCSIEEQKSGESISHILEKSHWETTGKTLGKDWETFSHKIILSTSISAAKFTSCESTAFLAKRL
ncbi:MAG: hypothetical protein JST16_10745 [Bdellovibrionales bacterium]|nr:hypothetical protein [Bdellovibrionales bacterium]